MTDIIVVFTTCADEQEARKVAGHLLEKRLAACVNLIPGVRSMYWWQGKIEESAEWLLAIKSRRELMEQLTRELRRVHSYDTPEALALPVVDGSPDYLEWLGRETGSQG